MYRFHRADLEVLLVHPGGPFWKSKDAGAWSIPKGEIQADEEPLAAARREFAEELGITPTGNFVALRPIVQKGGKRVSVWAFEGDCNPDAITSNTFQLEWPPRSGRLQEFPEIDRAAFFPIEEAKSKINPAQIDCLEELKKIVSG